MKCPLLFIAYTNMEDEYFDLHSVCLKEECAWWEQDLNLCAIKELALELRYTQLRLADMGTQMPHKGQFTK